MGYPQPIATERSSPAKSSYPQRSSLNLPTELNNGIPSRVIFSISAKHISSPQSIPRRVFYSLSLFPNGVIFSYWYSCNHHPQRKQSTILQHQAQDSTFRHPSGIYFPRQKYLHKHRISIHYSMHIRITNIQSQSSHDITHFIYHGIAYN